MRAARFHEFGPPSVLRVEETPDPFTRREFTTSVLCVDPLFPPAELQRVTTV